MRSVLLIILFITSSLLSQVFKTERGKIEFLGLTKWNAQVLIDSIKSLRPNKPIHACAGELKKDFGFIEVSSNSYFENYNNLLSIYTVVTIVEDNRDNKIEYIDEPADSLNLLKQYKDCAEIIKPNRWIYLAGIQIYNLYKKGQVDSADQQLKDFGVEIVEVKPFWEYLLSKNTIADMNLAMWILFNDSNPINRKIAFAVLLNFSNYESTWWTVLQLQRLKKQQLSMPAIFTLISLGKNPRKVDWSPAIKSIKSILNGTNLFAFKNTLEILTKTKISHELADAVLNNSSELILSYLNAEHPETRKTAVDFIKQISGDKSINNSNDCKLWLTQYLNN